MNDNEVNLLNEIKKQIERFDGKASILSAIAGALLGLSFSWIPIFKNIENCCNITIKTCFLIIFVFLYVVFLCLAFLFFILTIFPRSKPKKINKIKTNNSNMYYKDLQKMKPDSIREGITFFLPNQQLLTDFTFPNGIKVDKQTISYFAVYEPFNDGIFLWKKFLEPFLFYIKTKGYYVPNNCFVKQTDFLGFANSFNPWVRKIR